MQKQKVFIPVEGENKPYDVIITKVGKSPSFIAAKEQEGYFFTTDELENFSIGLVERMANEISKESASFSSEKVYKEYVETLNKK